MLRVICFLFWDRLSCWRVHLWLNLFLRVNLRFCLLCRPDFDWVDPLLYSGCIHWVFLDTFFRFPTFWFAVFPIWRVWKTVLLFLPIFYVILLSFWKFNWADQWFQFHIFSYRYLFDFPVHFCTIIVLYLVFISICFRRFLLLVRVRGRCGCISRGTHHSFFLSSGAILRWLSTICHFSPVFHCSFCLFPVRFNNLRV
jgi:hypothetical protein